MDPQSQKSSLPANLPSQNDQPFQDHQENDLIITHRAESRNETGGLPNNSNPAQTDSTLVPYNDQRTSNPSTGFSQSPSTHHPNHDRQRNPSGVNDPSNAGRDRDTYLPMQSNNSDKNYSRRDDHGDRDFSRSRSKEKYSRFTDARRGENRYSRHGGHRSSHMDRRRGPSRRSDYSAYDDPEELESNLDNFQNSSLGGFIFNQLNIYPPLLGFGIPQRTASYIHGYSTTHVHPKQVRKGY